MLHDSPEAALVPLADGRAVEHTALIPRIERELNPGNKSGMHNGSAICSGHCRGFGGLMQHAASKRREEMTEDQVEQLWGDHGEEPDMASARLHRLLHEVLTEAGHEALRQEETSSGPNKRR